MDPYAQTNIQLYEQLRNEGYSPVQIGKIAEAYRLSLELFACVYRPAGKTFIAHLVGTASILASLNASIDIVIGGLLHAAYFDGDFGTGVYGVSEVRRRRLRQIVGFAAEEYIARYAALLWFTEERIRGVYRRVNDLNAIDRDVLLIRLANELEELLDFGWLHFSSLEDRRAYRDSSGRVVVEIAERIGYPTLAKELEKHLNRSAETDIPSDMKDEIVGGKASKMIPSRAIGLKPVPYLRRRFGSNLRRLRNSRVANPNMLYWRFYGFIRRSIANQ
jgi:(p)ppGpp synthase/HD superfamily hydrolase